MEQQQQGYPPVGSVWKASRPSFSRRIVTDPKTIPGLPLGWVAFIGSDDGDDFAYTMATPLDGWNRWAKDATRVSAPKPSPLAETTHAAAVEVLGRKLEEAERLLRVAERLLRVSRAREAHLINERDVAVGRLRNETSELRTKLAEGKSATATIANLDRACAELREQLDMVDRAIAKCQEAGPSAHSAPPGASNSAQERVRVIRYYHTEWQRMSTILERVHSALAYPK